MKKILLIITIIAVFASCGTYNSVDSMSQLRSGMSKGEVEYYLGLPINVLTVNYTQNGVQEVLSYRNNYNEIYAVEFWNDYLTGYEYLYDDRPYVAPAPPMYLPPAGRPIIVTPGHNRPARPGRPNRPNRPSRPERPDNNYRPGNNDRPGNNNRPGNNERPGNNDRPGNNRPSNNNSDRTSGGRSSSSRYGDRTSSGDRSSKTTTDNDDRSRSSSSRTSDSSKTSSDRSNDDSRTERR